MNSDYYNRDTIDAKLDSIHETLLRIELQTTKTNGRVTSLEMKNAKKGGEAKTWGIVAGVASSIIVAATEYFLRK